MAIKVIKKILISMIFQISFLSGWSSVLAGEASPMLTDPSINEAYKDCGLFVFDNKNDKSLSSSVNHFSNYRRPYWHPQREIPDHCAVMFLSKTLMPVSSTSAHRDGEYVTVKIVRRQYIPASHFCEGNPDYDECLQKVVFGHYGFYEDDQGRWKRRVYFSGGSEDFLEKTMLETINGTIRNADGITVISQWKRPYNLPDQTSSDWVSLYVIRRTPFGYIFAGTGGANGVLIPIDKTKESLAKASALIGRVIGVVQSVRMKSGG